MKIRLLAFASAGDAVGAGEQELELAEGSRVADLRVRLERDHPALAPLWNRLAVAVDGSLASPDQLLAEGSEVALLPPVSGGSARAGGAGAQLIGSGAPGRRPREPERRNPRPEHRDLEHERRQLPAKWEPGSPELA